MYLEIKMSHADWMLSSSEYHCICVCVYSTVLFHLAAIMA